MKNTFSDYIPTIFIGSSKEAKQIVEKINNILEHHLFIKLWYHDTFQSGEYPLESFKRELVMSDFALLIIHPDDKIIKRGVEGYTVRDNVLLELGMFLGVLGRRKVFYLEIIDNTNAENKKVFLPTDLLGLTNLSSISKDEFGESKKFNQDIKNICNEIIEHIKRMQYQVKSIKDIEIRMLPSESLAIGYFNNFLDPVCRVLTGTGDDNKIVIREVKKDQKIKTSDKENKDKEYDLKKHTFEFYIVLPNDMNKSSHEGFLNTIKELKLLKVEVKGVNNIGRSFPFYIRSKPKKRQIKLIDFPTTLLSAKKAIDFATPENTDKDLITRLELREIFRFKRALEVLLEDTRYSHIRENIKIINTSDLQNLN